MNEFMQEAFNEAEKALLHRDVPVGAVVEKDGIIIGRGHNTREGLHDPTGHAEINALRQAGETLKDWRLDNCTLYVTHEPCPMCSGAAIIAHIKHIVYGANEPRYGACGSQLNLVQFPGFPHNVRITGPIAQAQGEKLMQDFFTHLRK